ncbi:hypothetical protein AB0C27_23515 [Nonomuraea sp. NPDC048882]|uniref:hypothetical protein n=1 Tax=Nonomuraea sp. NPDC048882 TaxID=3154347 RepID=UPI00340CEECB
MYTMFIGGTAYITETSVWDGLASWFGDADKIGLPLVLVALAAITTATAPPRWRRTAGSTSAAALLLFVLVEIASCVSLGTDVFELLLTDSASWRLLLTAALVASAAWYPPPPFSWTGTARLARNLLRRPQARTRYVIVTLLIAAGALWLIASSFTPTR